MRLTPTGPAPRDCIRKCSAVTTRCSPWVSRCSRGITDFRSALLTMSRAPSVAASSSVCGSGLRESRHLQSSTPCSAAAALRDSDRMVVSNRPPRMHFQAIDLRRLGRLISMTANRLDGRSNRCEYRSDNSRSPVPSGTPFRSASGAAPRVLRCGPCAPVARRVFRPEKTSLATPLRHPSDRFGGAS